MKRIQLFEFEDFAWFPTTVRSTMTKLIVVLQKLMGIPEVVGELLLDIHQRLPFARIVDMGSGSGGVMPMAVEYLNAQQLDSPANLLLTDLHPNPQFVQAFNESQHANMSYSNTSLDASKLSTAPEGIKTMLNSFHHMPPAVAQSILASAQKNKQALLIYEMAENKIPTFVWVIMLPIGLILTAIIAIVLVPFVKPLSWKDLLFTWLVPIVPICYAWDGQASLPRMYTFEDVKNHLLPEEDENYTWEMATAKKKDGKAQGYYILGMPK